jgi:hypothetical protein
MSGARTRRRRLVAAAVLAALGSAALWAAARIPPRGELAARVLSVWLGRPVEVAGIEVRFRSGVDLELQGVRVAASAAAGPDAPPVFEVARALGRQSWTRLLAGQLVPLSWELVDPVLRLGAGAGDGADLSIPEVDLAVSGGYIEWRREGAAALVARDLTLEARRGSLGTRARGRAAGALYAGDTLLCSLDVDFEGWLDRGTVSGSVESLDLAQLPLASFPLEGLASGRFVLRRAAQETRLELVAGIAGLELAPPRLHWPLRPNETQIDASATWRGGVLGFELRRLRLDDIDVSGEVDVDPRPGGRSHAALAFADFRPGPSERLHPVHVLASLMQSWERRNERMAAGRILGGSLRWDLPTAELGAALSFDRRSTDEELEIRLEAEDGVYHAFDSGPPLEDISGSLEIRGNVLHVTRLRLRRGDDWLPELDIRVDGMTRFAHLPREERDVPEGAGVPLPGLSPLLRELAQRDGTAGQTWPMRLRNVDLYYPPALLPLRDARGELLRRGPLLEVKLERAVVGGVPAAVDVSWDDAAKRLAVDLRYQEGDVPPRAPAPHWLAASVETDQLAIGDWRFTDVGGRVTVVGDRAELGALRGRLAGGPVTARGEISLAQAEAAPYWIEFEGSGADASQLSHHVDLEPEDLVGTLSGKGRLEGRLAPDEDFLASARLATDLELRDGLLGGLPTLVAIARLPSLRGAPRALLGRPLVYRSASGHVAITDGVLTLSDARLDGPELRLIADGEIRLRDPLHTRDFLITLLFLRAVDDLIAQVPFVGRFVLGKDEGLLGASFRAEGPSDRIRVTPLPPEALRDATNWATGVISNGARRLGTLMRILPPAASEEKGNAERAADTRAQPDPGPP